MIMHKREKEKSIKIKGNQNNGDRRGWNQMKKHGNIEDAWEITAAI